MLPRLSTVATGGAFATVLSYCAQPSASWCDEVDRCDWQALACEFIELGIELNPKIEKAFKIDSCAALACPFVSR
jgi:hypothetical protein